MSNESTDESGARDAGDRVQRARQRRARDDRWLAQAKRGDADAYRHLVTEWTPGAFDRALHRGADERSAADAVLHAFTSLQGQLIDDDTTFGSRVMRIIEQGVPARPRSLGKAHRGAKRAAERLTRGTDPNALGADPYIGVMLWDALDVLGDRARDITDLHWRHGLESDEIAAATGESVVRVDDIIRKAPQGLGAALRTRLLWSGGKPDHEDLARDLKANNVRQFDSTAVRVIHGHLRGCSVCRSRSLIAIPAIEILEAVPLVAVPSDVERRVAGTSWAPFAAGAAGAAPAAAVTLAPLVEPTADPDPEPVAEPAVDPVVEPAVDPEPAFARVEDELLPEPEPMPEPEPVVEPEREPEPATAAMAAPTDTRDTAARTATTVGGTLAAGATAAGFLDAEAESTATADATEVLAPDDYAAPLTPPVETVAVPPAAIAEPAPERPLPGEPRDPSPTHDPVASRASERRDRPRWLIPAGIGAAVIILVSLVLVLTRGGDDKKTAIDAGPAAESTTTRPPSSTTTIAAAPPITAPETTQTTQPAPSTTPANGRGGGGGGGGGGNPVTTTTKPAAIIANVTYGMSKGTIYENDPGSTFTWNVTANGPVTVEVTGPGVSSSSASGSVTVCNPGSSCGIGTHYFSIVAKDDSGRQVGAGTAKLIVRD